MTTQPPYFPQQQAFQYGAPTAKEPLVSSSTVPETAQSWSPGAWKHIPWVGFGCMLIGIGGIVSWAAILITSAGKAVNDWYFQPAVYIAIVVAVTNIALTLALSKGATVFWWRRSMRERSTLDSLHHDWDHGDSFWSALRAGRRTSVLSIATLIVAFVPINGPLLQRASRPVPSMLTETTTLQLDASPDMPPGFTSVLSGRGLATSILSRDFQPIVQAFQDSRDIPMKGTGCKGNCTGAFLTGVGLKTNCSSYQAPYVIGEMDAQSNGSSTVNDNTFDATSLFAVDFLWTFGQQDRMHLNVQYKVDRECSGMLQVRNCTLSPATVRYPVVINGNKSTISLAPDTHVFNDTILSVQNITDYAVGAYPFPGQKTTFGGFALAMRNIYSSFANLRFVGAAGYEFISSGASVNKYVQVNNYTGGGGGSDCDITFYDPTGDMLDAARALMFRLAVAKANGSFVHEVTAFDTMQNIVWHSNYAYLAGAAALTLVAILSIIPSFSGYWSLGRKTSMSPLEIARAFGAPMLSQVGSNVTAKTMAREIGGRGAQYGVNGAQELRIGSPGSEVDPLHGRAVVR